MTTNRNDFDATERLDYEPRGVVYAGALPILRQISGEFSFFLVAAVIYGVSTIGHMALTAAS